MNTGSTAAVQTTRHPLVKEKVQSFSLAELFGRHSVETRDLLKVDIEGYEYEAILGSCELFTNHRVKIIALEMHPQSLAKRNLSPDKITGFLNSCGYKSENSFSNTVFVSPKHELRLVAGQGIN